jgi:hypothetical protein
MSVPPSEASETRVLRHCAARSKLDSEYSEAEPGGNLGPDLSEWTATGAYSGVHALAQHFDMVPKVCIKVPDRPPP